MSEERIAGMIEALDSLDDCARMDVGVDAVGPRGVLERGIAFFKREIETLKENDRLYKSLNKNLCNENMKLKREIRELKRSVSAERTI